MALVQQLLGQLRFVVRVASTNLTSLQAVRAISITSSLASSQGSEGEDLTAGEKHLADKLQKAFPDATHVQVSDVSGGCGAMYQISIESAQFKGKRTIQQHRMVNEVLAEDIKAMHGLQLNTKAPDTK